MTVGGARRGFKPRVSGERRIQGNIACGEDTRIRLRYYADVQNVSMWQLKSETTDASGRGAGRQAEAL
jgi:hypothetical protein